MSTQEVASNRASWAPREQRTICFDRHFDVEEALKTWDLRGQNERSKASLYEGEMRNE